MYVLLPQWLSPLNIEGIGATHLLVVEERLLSPATLATHLLVMEERSLATATLVTCTILFPGNLQFC